MSKKGKDDLTATKLTHAKNSADFMEPMVPGTSVILLGGKPLHKYMIWLTFCIFIGFAVMSANSILVPNQIQSIEFHKYFTGADANVDLTKLANLKISVADGAVATAEQQRLLDIYDKFDSSRTSIWSFANTLMSVILCVFLPILGVISDRTRSRFGRRNLFVLIGAFFGVACLCVLRFGTSIPVIVIFFALVSLAVNIGYQPLQSTVADRTTEANRGKVSGVSAIGNMLGGVLGSVIVGVTFAKLGLNLYFVLAALMLLGYVMFVIKAKDRSSVELHVEPFNWGSFFKGFLIPLKDRDFRLVWIARCVLIFGFTVSSVLSFFMLQGYIQPALSAAEATKIAPLLGLVMLPSMLIASAISGSLSDKLGRRKPFVIVASVMMSAAMIIPLIWPVLTSLFVMNIVVGLAYGLYLPVDQALFVDVLPDKNAAGRDLAVGAVATTLGQSLGPIIAGLVVTLTGGYAGVYVVAAVVILSAALFIIPVKRAR